MLTGGHPNSLGRTVEVVEMVQQTPDLLAALYRCYDSADEVVRLRTSSAFKRLFRAEPAWFDAYADRFIDEVAAIDQASAQWTVAQLCGELTDRLTPAQRRRATTVLQRLLQQSDDWIVLNAAMQTLGDWAVDDAALAAALRPELARLSGDTRKSVARRAAKLAATLG